jgi:hypothetical protein
MAQLLAWRSVSSRPLRALLLCGGFGVGVGVMIVLLAVGEAMVKEVWPGPSKPRPLVFGPFFTKIEQSMATAISCRWWKESMEPATGVQP